MKRFISMLLVLMLCLANATVFASAAPLTNESVPMTPETHIEFTEVYDEATGQTYFEFTVPENYNARSMTSHTETVTAYNYHEFDGKTFTATDNRISVSAKAGNVGGTVTICLEVKANGANLYYDVASKAIACDGANHQPFSGITIEAGRTYRFTYSLNNSSVSTVTVNLAAVMFTV